MTDGENRTGIAHIDQPQSTELCRLLGNVALVVIHKHDAVCSTALHTADRRIAGPRAEYVIAIRPHMVDGRLQDSALLISEQSVFSGMGIEGRHRHMAVPGIHEVLHVLYQAADGVLHLLCRNP